MAAVRSFTGGPGAMPDSDFFLFVSHVREDRQVALEIVDELERRGVPCWIAPRDVRAGKPFDDEIAEAIEACRAMLLVFSDRCNEHDYIRREITVAGETRKVIIPFRIEDAEPRHGLRVRLSDLHWIDGFVSRERAIDQVVGTLDPARMRQQEEKERRQREEEQRQYQEEERRRQALSQTREANQKQEEKDQPQRRRLFLRRLTNPIFAITAILVVLLVSALVYRGKLKSEADQLLAKIGVQQAQTTLNNERFHIFLHFGNRDIGPDIANKLKSKLSDQGYSVVGVDRDNDDEGGSGVDFFHDPDCAAAVAIANVASQALPQGAPPLIAPKQSVVKPPGMIGVWISRKPPTQPSATCK